MKKLLTIFFALLILFGSMGNAFVFVAFKINQAEIEALFCINKDKPAMKCHGHCYLSQQLAANSEKNNPKSPLSNLEDTFKINFFHQPSPATNSPEELVSGGKVIFQYHGFLTRLYATSIFQPPDYQPINC